MFEYIQYMLDWIKNWASWAVYWWKEDDKEYFEYKLNNYYAQKDAKKNDFPFNQMNIGDYTTEEFKQFKKLYLEPEHGLFVSGNINIIPDFNLALINHLKRKVRPFENVSSSKKEGYSMFSCYF